jgi:hypothetical protein
MCNTRVPWHAQITWQKVMQLSWGWQACEPLCTVTAYVTCDTAGMRVPCMKSQPVILQVPRVMSRMRDRVTCTVFMTHFCTQWIPRVFPWVFWRGGLLHKINTTWCMSPQKSRRAITEKACQTFFQGVLVQTQELKRKWHWVKCGRERDNIHTGSLPGLHQKRAYIGTAASLRCVALLGHNKNEWLWLHSGASTLKAWIYHPCRHKSSYQ